MLSQYECISLEKPTAFNGMIQVLAAGFIESWFSLWSHEGGHWFVLTYVLGKTGFIRGNWTIADPGQTWTRGELTVWGLAGGLITGTLYLIRYYLDSDEEDRLIQLMFGLTHIFYGLLECTVLGRILPISFDMAGIIGMTLATIVTFAWIHKRKQDGKPLTIYRSLAKRL